jgi:mRNA interferase MazF
VNQGEIWDINLGRKKSADRQGSCPVIIINDDTIGIIPSRVIAPLMEWQDKFENAIWMVRINPNTENNLGRISVVDVLQLYTIPTKHFIKKIGILTARELQQVKNAVKAIINAD